MYTKFSTEVRTVNHYVTVRENRPEIGASVIFSSGYPKRQIRATVTGVVERNGIPVQFVVKPEGSDREKYLFIPEVYYVWKVSPGTVQLEVPALAATLAS